ncbi:helix-turn-helix domain-containing protein [Nocardioides panzhihuensis]|uniref:AraC-like DNA-binding protein n=1 Tax=Nocardioides panzhihuensis TaxID=860243 RepID=A0A7Z0DL15_9ACTN|nr:AraC-like DNA-binding protein [Nocardioides panzhihuensis]
MSIDEIAEVVRDHGTPLLQAADDIDAVVGACATALRPHMLRVRGRGADLAARLDHLPSAVGLSRLRYGADVTISGVAPEQDEFIVVLPVAGRARFDYGRTTAALGPGAMSVVSPYRPFTLEIGRDFDQVLVRLERRQVESAAAALIGAAKATPVHFELTTAQVSPGLVGLIDAAARLAADPHVVRRTRLAVQVETLIVDALLLGYPSNLSGKLAGAAKSPSAERVSRAMDYMLANLADQPLLSDVARHCGVTLRSLQLGFRREVGMSPGEWLRNQRLERAHAQLSLASEAETTVTAVAVACGFLHLGDFAARFKQRFGESPSAVLRGSRL